MIQDCRTRADYEKLSAESRQRPVFLFKHSTRCPISAGRWRVFEQFAATESRASFYRLLVVEDRAVSQYVAQECGVRHQSPQVILYWEEKPIWHTSHYSITEDEMLEALSKVVPI